MYNRSNFLRVSAFVVIAVLAAFSVLGSAKASLPNQATTAPTDVTAAPTGDVTATVEPTMAPTGEATTSPTVVATTSGGTGGTGSTGGAVETATATATFDESAAFPPCPEVVMSTPESASDATATAEMTAAATTATTADQTMEATLAGTPEGTMEATTSATMEMPTAQGTEEATPEVGTFAEQEGCTFTAELRGENERPEPGDPDGEGTATVTISRPEGNTFGQVCFEIQVSGIELPAVAAHIHRGTADVAGPIVVPFSAPDKDGVARGCTTNVNRGTIRLIVTHPDEFYVNVHTTDFPKGALRGQLMPAENEGEGTTTP